MGIAKIETTGTLPLSDNIIRTQFDTAPSYHVDDDDNDDLPPLTTYLPGCKFWCKFAIWPFVFITLNAIVVSTLVSFDDYEFQYGQQDRVIIQFEMLKYIHMVITILLFADALVLYHSAKFLEKKCRELDRIGNVNDDDIHHHSLPTSGSMKPNVHAQVSRKLDNVLGRSPQSRVSIFVSMLWLLFVGCGTVGLVSFANCLFFISPIGIIVCKKRARNTRSSNFSSHDHFNRGKQNYISNIPDELQEWATQSLNHHGSGSIIHLTNGRTYFQAEDPQLNEATSQKNVFFFEHIKPPQELPKHLPHLISIGSDGTIQFYKNVLLPSFFTSVSGESPLNSTGFCCIYRHRPASVDSNHQSIYDLDTSLLCIQSSDIITDGLFNNVTLHQLTNDRHLMTVSLQPYNNELWIKMMFDIDDNTHMEFYKVTPSKKLEMTLVPDTTSFSGHDWHDTSYEEPFLIGPPLPVPCYTWTDNIDSVVLFVVLVAASKWLLVIKKLSVGIVPACAVGCILITSIAYEMGLTICSLTAFVTFLGLLRVIPIHLCREKLVWSMYTLLLWVAAVNYMDGFVKYSDNIYHFNSVLFTITIMSLIGFILNHPVLYLCGWIGGIWAIFYGTYLILTPFHHQGLFAMGVGIVMGSGCVTVGFNLIQYRAHIIYYSKRAWVAVNSAMQHPNYHDQNNTRRTNTNTPTYAPGITYTTNSIHRSNCSGRE
jgi:hypothetical protein